LRAILSDGQHVRPRNIATRELRAFHFSIEDPRRRFVSIAPRRWNFAYALGEFCWHIRGSDSLEEIAFYSPRWRSVSDDGVSIRSSCYGAKIFDCRDGRGSQWDVSKHLLVADPDTRRSILILADPLDQQSYEARDVSCATSVQFTARSGKLDATVSMRSNDAVLGLPYDVFLFTMLQEMMACELHLELGAYHHFAGSLHIYESDFELADAVASAEPQIHESMDKMSNVDGAKYLLSCERASREGTQLSDNSCDLDSYWMKFASVLEHRNRARRGFFGRMDEVIVDPLSLRLAKLGSSFSD